MTGDVADLDQARAERQPHLSGPARCQHCKHEWIAVAPVGQYAGLDCPGCDSSRGYFTQHVTPADGVERFACSACDCQVFTVRREGAQCIGCGVLHSWDDLQL